MARGKVGVDIHTQWCGGAAGWMLLLVEGDGNRIDGLGAGGLRSHGERDTDGRWIGKVSIGEAHIAHRACAVLYTPCRSGCASLNTLILP